MRKLSEELRERLAGQRGENPPPLPMSHFVRVEWPLDGDGEETARHCYSTLAFPVTMDGNRYEGCDRLLDFDEGEQKDGFVMWKDELRNLAKITYINLAFSNSAKTCSSSRRGTCPS